MLVVGVAVAAVAGNVAGGGDGNGGGGHGGGGGGGCGGDGGGSCGTHLFYFCTLLNAALSETKYGKEEGSLSQKVVMKWSKLEVKNRG